jgi:DNA-binding transcriptional LysR family regulator
MLDVKRMRVLSEVVRTGSFSAAADSLHLSQSAVSQQVAALEKEVGMQLLERTSDGPKLTAAGETLMSHADAVITRLAEAERELSGIAGLEGGRLRVISFPTASATLMTRALSEFRRRFPNVELQLAEGEPEESLPAIRRGDYDLALAFDFTAHPEDFGRDIAADLIFEEKMRVGLPQGHPLAASEAVDVSTLADEDWLVGTGSSSCRTHMINICRDAGFDPRVSFESDDYQVLFGLAEAGLGVALLPELAGDHPGVALRPIEPDAPIRRIWAITREPESRSPAAEQMLAILNDVGATYGKDDGLKAVA